VTLDRPRRLWLWLLAGTAAVILLGGLYFMAGLNGVRALERHWRHSEAVSKAFNDYVSDSRWDDYQTADFVIEGQADRDPIARYATQEYAKELRAEAKRVDGVLAVDPGVRGLRRDMAAALRSYADGLDESAKAPKVTPPIFEQRTNVTVAALSQLDRWGLRPRTKEVTAHFAPDPTKAPVTPLLDEKTGVKLVTVSDRDLVTIDIDTGRVAAIWKDWDPDSYAFEAVRDWVAYKVAVTGRVWVPGNSLGTELGLAERMLAGPNPDTVWLQREEAGAGRSVPLAEVDREGREQATAMSPGLPLGVTPSHVVSLVVVPGRSVRARMAVTERATGREVRGFEDALPFSTHQHLVAWGGGLTDPLRANPTSLSVLDMATGQNRAVPPPDATSQPVAAVFSPDGRSLAVLWSQPGPTPTTRVAIHPLDTLQAPAFTATDAEMAASNLVWAPSSERVFFILNPRDKATDGFRIGTMRRSDNAVQRLRIKGAFRRLDTL